MSRYDILLNDPKKEIPPKEQTPASHTPANRRYDDTTIRPPDEATARPIDEQSTRPDNRPTGKGILVRRGFEYREDQLRALKTLSLKEQMEGKQGSMSAMVREALDVYLKKRALDK